MVKSKGKTRETPPTVSSNIPNKRFFRIGEVSQIVGVPPHVLRYWEHRFSAVRPLRALSNQRRYRRADVAKLLRIKALLHHEKYTISGAREKLDLSRRQQPEATAADKCMEQLREELIALRRLLD